jgi:hypothetical protein
MKKQEGRLENLPRILKTFRSVKLMTVMTLTDRGVRIVALIALCLAYIAMTGSPAAAQGFSVAFGRAEFIVSPGDRFIGTIPVLNITDEPVSLRVYLADRLRVPGQTSEYDFDEEGGHEPRSFLDWAIFSPERLTLDPDETQDINYEVNVPDDPTLEGSYWVVIFIESIPTTEPDIIAEGEEGISVGIRTIFRYAIQIYATIEGTETREANFTSLNLEPAEGWFNATAVLENTGNIHIRPDVWLELRDIAGELVYEEEHGEQTVLPESARDFVFEIRNLPIESGEYLVMILADYGVPTLIAAQGRLNLMIEPPAPEEVVVEPEAEGSEGEESVEPEGSG